VPFISGLIPHQAFALWAGSSEMASASGSAFLIGNIRVLSSFVIEDIVTGKVSNYQLWVGRVK
jgi:hypothetical protein